MDGDAVYLPDDEDALPAEDLATLLAEGVSESVTGLCAHGPSAFLLLGCLLLIASALIVGIRIAWATYAQDITDFYREVALQGGGPLAAAAAAAPPAAAAVGGRNPAFGTAAAPLAAPGAAGTEVGGQRQQPVDHLAATATSPHAGHGSAAGADSASAPAQPATPAAPPLAAAARVEREREKEGSPEAQMHLRAAAAAAAAKKSAQMPAEVLGASGGGPSAYFAPYQD